MVQRLEKLHDLLGFDPHDSDHWLALHIALKLLQRPRERQPQGGPADAEG
jgi:DNA-binding PucR family transcriptional regulator